MTVSANELFIVPNWYAFW